MRYAYNLIERGLEIEVLPMAAALKLAIVVYRPLSAGVLTGKYLQGIPADARGVNDERLDPWTRRYAEGIHKLIAFAAARGYTALAWVRAPAGPAGRSAVTAPIVGISRMEQLEENLKGWASEMTAEEHAK